jgi:hypothetical protein
MEEIHPWYLDETFAGWIRLEYNLTVSFLQVINF